MTRPPTRAEQRWFVDRKSSLTAPGPHDGFALLAVHTRAIEMIAVKDYGPDIARSWAHGLTPDGYARSMADGEIFEVAVLDGAIIGFCGIKLGEICGLYVDPDHMRRGVATQLLSHALAWMDTQGCERVKIEASLTALPLYLRHGFRNVATKLKGTRGGLDMLAVDMER